MFEGAPPFKLFFPPCLPSFPLPCSRLRLRLFHVKSRDEEGGRQKDELETMNSEIKLMQKANKNT